MKSNRSPESIARVSATGSSGSTTNGYSASVPLSVYRELTAELQATKAKLDAATLQNQQLAQHNQDLRQRVDQVYESVASLRQAFDSSSGQSSPDQEPAFQVTDDITSELRRALTMQPPSSAHHEPARSTVEKSSAPGVRLPFATDDDLSTDAIFLEGQAESSSDLSSKSHARLGGLWLTITLIVVIVTAFGAGFTFIWVFQQNNSR